VLCGPACAGKSTLGRLVAARIGATLVTARDAIEEAVGSGPLTREQLIREGAALEARQPGGWLAQAVARAVPLGQAVVVDAARTRAQLKALDRRCRVLLRVFVEAPESVREERFAERTADAPSEGAFSDVAASPIEQEAKQLAIDCDLVLNTAERPPEVCAQAILDALEGGTETLS
jgi:adenylate kinase family enzyme